MQVVEKLDDFNDIVHLKSRKLPNSTALPSVSPLSNYC